jgi:hypothetical protein
MSGVTWSSLPFYLVPFALLVLVATLLCRRRLFSVYPAFFLYVCFSVVRTAVLLVVALRFTQTHKMSLYNLYFYIYWWTEPLSVVLTFVIIYRVFAATLAPYALLRRWTPVLYMLALAAALLLAIFVVPAEIRSRGIMHIAVPLWQASTFLRTGLLAVLFLVVFGIGIRVRDYLFGIAAGLGAEAGLPLVASCFKSRSIFWLSYAHTIGDSIAIVIWLVYLFVPRREPAFSGTLTAGGPDLPGWKDALSEFLHKS